MKLGKEKAQELYNLGPHSPRRASRLAKVAALSLSAALLAAPAYAAQNVVDSNGTVLGPLMSTAAIPQGVVLEIRFDGSICEPDDTSCEDPVYIDIPWTSEGIGEVLYGSNYPNTLPQQTWYYTTTDCESDAYLMVQSATTTQAKPYEVVGGDSDSGELYWPAMTDVETAAQLGIVAESSSPIAYYEQRGKGPAYGVQGACLPAWVKPDALFALMQRDSMGPEEMQSQLGITPPFTTVEAAAEDNPPTPSPADTPSMAPTPSPEPSQAIEPTPSPDPATPAPTPAPKGKKAKVKPARKPTPAPKPKKEKKS